MPFLLNFLRFYRVFCLFRIKSSETKQDYQIKEDELKYLGARAKLLLELAIRICEERIQQILKEPKKYMKK